MATINRLVTFMHLADAFIQSDLVHSGYTFVLSVCVFPGNRTHNLCAANAMKFFKMFYFLTSAEKETHSGLVQRGDDRTFIFGRTTNFKIFECIKHKFIMLLEVFVNRGQYDTGQCIPIAGLTSVEDKQTNYAWEKETWVATVAIELCAHARPDLGPMQPTHMDQHVLE